jgi:signal transduction histidine kinase
MVELKRLGEAMRRWESCEITTINYKKNGEEFWINFSLTPVANEKGWFTHWIAIERDVTKTKKYISAIENQNIKLREIAWAQSHIVRAPLARMMGIVGLLGDFKYDSSEYNEWVKHFSDSASELDNIIKDIVDKAQNILVTD